VVRRPGSWLAGKTGEAVQVRARFAAAISDVVLAVLFVISGVRGPVEAQNIEGDPRTTHQASRHP